MEYCYCCFNHQVVPNSSVTPRTVARQAPLSMEFPRQEYWSGLPFPSPEIIVKMVMEAWKGEKRTEETI